MSGRWLIVLAIAGVLAAPAVAATPFAVTWAHWYNAESALRKVPFRITQIGCGPQGMVSGKPYRKCDATVIYKGRAGCERIIVETVTYQPVAAWPIACKGTKASPLAIMFRGSSDAISGGRVHRA